MKSRTKIELSRAAGVSPETFRRWLKTDRAFLEANGIRPTTKLFPPKVVKYLCEKSDKSVRTHGRLPNRSTIFLFFRGVDDLSVFGECPRRAQ